MASTSSSESPSSEWPLQRTHTLLPSAPLEVGIPETARPRSGESGRSSVRTTVPGSNCCELLEVGSDKTETPSRKFRLTSNPRERATVAPR